MLVVRVAACIIVAVLCLSVAGRSAAAFVGYETVSVPDSDGSAIEVGIWYPTSASPALRLVGPFEEMVSVGAPVLGEHLPLVVMSHGTGASFTSHLDTADALANAGFVVAALTHTGDSYLDQSRATDVMNRPRQLKVLTDYMIEIWPQHGHIDPARIGAFGFSSGGFTVLVAVGGEPDLTTVGDHCRAHPEYFDCDLIARVGVPARADGVWTHDTRIKAAVVAAPALGFAFSRAGLSAIKLPIQLWRAGDDHILPNPDYAEAVRLNLPSPPDYRVVAGADHFDFLAPCSDILVAAAPQICESAPGFDRTQFHEDFNRAVAAFFRTQLP